MTITGRCGYWTLKPITDVLLLLLLLLLTISRMGLELFKAVHLETGTFTDALKRINQLLLHNFPIHHNAGKATPKPDGRN
jgi:hypothetical protein